MVFVFFDLMKCFNTIDPEILLFKLDKYGIRNSTLYWFRSYLSNRSQCTLVNGKLSNFTNVSIGIPQGSVLGPILFLLFMNYLPSYVESVTLFADDTMLDVSARTIDEVVPKLQTEIKKLVEWFFHNKLTVNVKKSSFMLIGSPQKTSEYCNVQNLGLNINGEKLCNVTTYRYLGVSIDSHLNWNQNVNVICKKLGSRISVVQRLSRLFPQIYVNKIYYAFIQPYIDYALTVRGTTSASNIGKIQRLQNRNGRIMSNHFNYDQPGLSVVNNLGWQNVTDRYQFLSCVYSPRLSGL